MKIRFDGAGNISACCVDAQNLGGHTVVTIPDNADLMANPNKYTWDALNCKLVLRKAVSLSTFTPTALANGSAVILVNLAATDTSGNHDASASYVVTISDALSHGNSSPVSVTLSAGAGSASYTSASPKRMLLVARAESVCGGSLAIVFA